MQLVELDDDPAAPFPPVQRALREPDGLLAWGGDLSPQRLVNAYRHGCFPWFEPGQPILWWSPDPRLLLASERFHVSRSFARFLRRSDWTVTINTAFARVIDQCANIARDGQRGTWIVPAMCQAYTRLHQLGHAHSVEVWSAQAELVGGIYGVGIGRMFFGESMFSRRSNGSKVALIALCRHLHRHGMPLIDCQMETDHLLSLGAVVQDRAGFLARSRQLSAADVDGEPWLPSCTPVPVQALLA
ncbi:MAG: leucyl/phenylalanyl-tRNA--protein transferase [Xanthomonadales bacterium]|nr:leucyl/phenylalanyl-tRNA--protein transferase [Xanthomonadales bacterium]